jgi:3',5'-cyclic AMP phosphodiesterase CpdA
MRFFIVLMLMLSGCGRPEFSPWESDFDSKQLTQHHLNWLSQSNTTFKPFKFAIAGDPQAVQGHLREVIDSVNNSPVDFLAILGDITDLGLKTEWKWVDNSINKSNKPLLTVVGNHDGLTKGNRIYQRLFGALNYSFIYKDIKFVMWNNNYFEWGDPDFDWLEQEVLSHPRVIVMSHQPPYSDTFKPYHDERWKLIRNHPNYIASLHGHVHHYSYEYEFDTKTHIFTVDRVTGTHYTIVTVGSDDIYLQNCTPQCRGIK